jgi:hypothetical protein
MKKLLLSICVLCLAFVASAQQVATRVYGTTVATNRLVIPMASPKIYALSGYTTTTQFIMVFQTNALPANGTVGIFSIPVTAGQFYSFDWSFYGVDLDKVTICNSTTANTLTLGASDTTFQAVLRQK